MKRLADRTKKKKLLRLVFQLNPTEHKFFYRAGWFFPSYSNIFHFYLLVQQQQQQTKWETFFRMVREIAQVATQIVLDEPAFKSIEHVVYAYMVALHSKL